MSVVSAHGAAPSQQDAAQASHTSNRSNVQSIACAVMFIKATDIHPCTNCCTTLQWLMYTETASFFYLAVEMRGRCCLRCREMLIFLNYAFSWSRECLMCAAFMKGKHNDESKCIYCPLQITDLYTGPIHMKIMSSSSPLKHQCFDLMLGGNLH